MLTCPWTEGQHGVSLPCEIFILYSCVYILGLVSSHGLGLFSASVLPARWLGRMSFFTRVMCATFVSMEQLDDEIIELHFQETLDLHGEMLTDLLREQIEKKKLVDTGDLEESIDYKVVKREGGQLLQINFMMYGRQVDRLGYKKIKHDVDLNSVIWGLKENKKNKESNKRWYASFMYHDYDKLISRLMYGLGEDELKRLKNIINNRKLL